MFSDYIYKYIPKAHQFPISRKQLIAVKKLTNQHLIHGKSMFTESERLTTPSPVYCINLIAIVPLPHSDILITLEIVIQVQKAKKLKP